MQLTRAWFPTEHAGTRSVNDLMGGASGALIGFSVAWVLQAAWLRTSRRAEPAAAAADRGRM